MVQNATESQNMREIFSNKISSEEAILRTCQLQSNL
jgi:hypothetical protein